VQFITRLGKRKGLSKEELVANAVKSDIDEDEARELIDSLWDDIPMPDPETDEREAKRAIKAARENPVEYSMPVESKDSL
jgi:hypothetical protein